MTTFVMASNAIPPKRHRSTSIIDLLVFLMNSQNKIATPIKIGKFPKCVAKVKTRRSAITGLPYPVKMVNRESRPIIVQISAMSQPLKSPTQENTIDKNNNRICK